MDVAVVIGAGGMGRAIAARIGSGRHVLLADRDEQTLAAVRDQFLDDGYTVTIRPVDVADPGSVNELAATAADLGPVTQIAHTAGLSPVQAATPAIFAVDLFGVAYALAAFEPVIAPGGAGLVIASMAGHLATLSPEHERALAVTPPADLPALDFLTADLAPTQAYPIAKRANILRVQAAAGPWGRRGARINSISPGVISTAMGRAELDGASGAAMRTMIERSAARRPGTPQDIVNAAAFLLDPASTFITGTDLLVDGGVVASLRAG